MNSKSLRRLAADHGSLHTAGLPPNYLFPPSSDGAADLTSLDILLAGPVGTPYAAGVWRLHLDIPPTYPSAPPTAHFRTRLWHPNIDEATGAVCVETLKRDWSSTLKLRDVLVTISCLLIQPNPASALNEAAGKLATEDWQTYCRRARLMTEIHAAVPSSIIDQVKEAQMRGEEHTAEPEAEAAVKTHALKAKATPSTSKAQRLAAEDEENRRRHGDAHEPESDPESDWIPGPDNTGRPSGVQGDHGNIFGINGLDESMQQGTEAKRVLPTTPQSATLDEEGQHDHTDSFTIVTSKSKAHGSHSFDLRLPPATNTSMSKRLHSATPDTPELLKFSHHNPFSAICLNDQTHAMREEFSYSWGESDMTHATRVSQVGSDKRDAWKRLAGDDFEKKKRWEMKRFRRAGYNLARYNCGDFGPRTGIGRL